MSRRVLKAKSQELLLAFITIVVFQSLPTSPKSRFRLQ